MSSGTSMVHCQLWMGGLEPYMTESFILSSFQRMGEKPMNVKVMRNKYTGEPAGYCFVHFENDDEAIDAMHKLNGKIIPGTNPAVRFRLNTASNQGKIMMNEREFSLWVGDLSPEVDDYTLFKCFAAKYQSIKAAKVILDASGYSKGFGFLRFGLEEEQKHCLNHMNGYKGLGSKPLKISNAIPKSQRSGPPNGPQMNQQGGGYQYPPDYSHYYDPNYWQNYGQWGSYGYDPNSTNYGTGYDPNSGYAQYGGQYAGQYGTQYPGQYGAYPPPAGGYPHPPYPGYYPTQTPATGAPPPTSAVTSAPPPTTAPSATDDANEVVEHSIPIDVEKENREYADAILNFWVDLASNTGTGKELFEEEMSKLNVIEVTNPPVTIKFETRLAAKRAVENQGFEGSLSSATSEGGSESEEPATKKQRLSTEGKSGDESGKDEVKEESDVKVKTEGDDGTVNDSTLTGNGTTASDVKLEAEVKVEDAEVKVEDPEAKEKMRVESLKVFGLMASVDVDYMMNETERVSSDSSGDSSEADEADGTKDKKGKSKATAENVETGDGAEGVDKEEPKDTMECEEVPSDDVDKQTLPVPLEDFNNMSEMSDGEEVVQGSMMEGAGDLVEKDCQRPEGYTGNAELGQDVSEPRQDVSEPAQDLSEPAQDLPEPAQDSPADVLFSEELTIEDCLEDNSADQLVIPSSMGFEDESHTSLEESIKPDPSSDSHHTVSDTPLGALLNGQDPQDRNSAESREQTTESSDSD